MHVAQINALQACGDISGRCLMLEKKGQTIDIGSIKQADRNNLEHVDVLASVELKTAKCLK